jgi:hypothetical protein
MTDQRAIDVMVFAVHVRSDASTDGRVFRARCHRQEPAPRDDEAKNLIEGDARLDLQDPRAGFEMKESVEL